jgi:hypothetical protein
MGEKKIEGRHFSDIDHILTKTEKNLIEELKFGKSKEIIQAIFQIFFYRAKPKKIFLR